MLRSNRTLFGSLFNRVFIFINEVLRLVLGFLDAIGLFERFCLVGIPQNIAIRTLSAFQRSIAAFVQGFPRGQILQRLVQVRDRSASCAPISIRIRSASWASPHFGQHVRV